MNTALEIILVVFDLSGPYLTQDHHGSVGYHVELRHHNRGKEPTGLVVVWVIIGRESSRWVECHLVYVIDVTGILKMNRIFVRKCFQYIS